MTQNAIYVSQAFRLYVLLVLAVAVVSKAAIMRDFRMSVAELLRLPERPARAAAFAVVGAEGLIALLLAAGGSCARAGMAAASVLFTIFAIVILVALIQGRSVLCNCFGGRSHVISIHDLLRNAILIVACGFYLLHVPTNGTLDAAAWFLLFGVALILFLVSMNLDEIVLLNRRA